MNLRRGQKDSLRGLDACTPSDFDGHTRFAAMTPEQRLAWLDDAREFIVEYGGAASQQTARRSANSCENQLTERRSRLATRTKGVS
jgi:hypothetical protein